MTKTPKFIITKSLDEEIITKKSISTIGDFFIIFGFHVIGATDIKIIKDMGCIKDAPHSDLFLFDTILKNN